ncbi:6-pyruvoyl trahydropterin synthase family protein [Sinomonas terrae]|uniref:6-carboxy-5,6,7,8-tetrahydropterin synthase n=1 Tax=Sinomonas terrae TaxID=2908838 RepID=A0ABS9U4V1_9MICC|nr:6-carboxytetrahydropterin synthase [Sinomonas terrae]MCH6471709.1 6-carboxytetrahydropterin synthase [Sinomonas terrae]
MYSLTVRDHIMIAHSLPRPAFGPAQGLHGATFVVELTVRARELDENATVMDIGALSGVLGEALEGLRYQNLDEHPAFEGKLSTTEAIARHLAEDVAGRLNALAGAAGAGPAGAGAVGAGDRLVGLSVVLRENPDAWAGYSLELP